MRQSSWGFYRAPAIALAAVGLALGACSGMPGLGDVKLPTTSTLFPTNPSSYNLESVSSNRPVTAADLVDAQGACAGAAGVVASGEPGAPAARGVGLYMTECQVVQVLGAAQSTEIGTNERGERAVTMTFLAGDRAGIYRFVGGRLTSIERAPGAPEPEKPAKKQPPKKQAKKPQPA
jgi:hypothetical protein